MDGRISLITLASLAIVGVGFAGCLEAPSFLFASDVEATAMEARGRADEAAATWRADARLVQAFALEMAEADEEVPADPAVGNGRATVWWFSYASGNDTAEWRVAADGNVTLMEEESSDHEDDLAPLGEWSVDSDRAIERALENESFRRVALAPNATLAEGVGMEEGAAQWFFAAGSPEGLVFATVDARTGALLGVEETSFGFAVPAWPGMGGSWGGGAEPEVAFEEEGTLDAGERVAEFPFTTTSPGLPAHLEIAIGKQLPTDALAWSVRSATDQEDVYGEGSLGRSGFMGDEAEEDFVLGDAGDYVLVLEYRGAEPLGLGAVDFELEFTAGGSDWDFDFDWG